MVPFALCVLHALLTVLGHFGKAETECEIEERIAVETE